MSLDEDLARDSVELARMSLEADTFDDKMMLIRMALLVRRQAAVEGMRLARCYDNERSAEHAAPSADQ